MNETILVVDDDPSIRKFINRVLSRAGYQVHEADDGFSALNQIAIARPALVLADLMMPHMRGDTLIAHLRHDLNPIPCILMSAYDVDAPPTTVPFLAKPFAMTDLLRVVSELLHKLAGGSERALTRSGADVRPHPNS